MNAAGFLVVDAVPYIDWWCERFGTDPAVFAEFGCYQRGKRSVWVAYRDIHLGHLSPVDGVGIPFLRVGGADWKATSAAAVRFGHLASRQVVELETSEAAAVLRGEAVPLVAGDPRREHARGHLIARLGGVGIGCVRLVDGDLLSEIPRGRQSEMADLPPGA